MTVGTTYYTTGFVGNGVTCTTVYKSWDGVNGRFETVNGFKRDKWNRYSLDLFKHVQTPGINPDGKPSSHYPNVSCGIPNLWTANDDLALLSQLTQSVKGHGFNLGVSIGEGRETINMITQTAKTIAVTLKHLKGGNLAAATRSLLANQPNIEPRQLTSKTLASRWLELQYGWKPLLSDIHNGAQAFAQLTAAPRVTRFVVTKSKKKTYNGSCSSAYWLGGFSNGNHTESKQIIYEASELLSTPRSLGLLDPLSVAWELLPYSFVADWFIPIGTYLEALNTVPNLAGRFLTSKKMVTQATLGGCTANSGYKGCRASFYKVILSRIPSSSLSVPLPTFKPLDKALSAGHVWNAIALMRNSF